MKEKTATERIKLFIDYMEGEARHYRNLGYHNLPMMYEKKAHELKQLLIKHEDKRIN